MNFKWIIFGFFFSLLIFHAHPYSAFAKSDGGDIYYEDTKAKPPALFSHETHKQVGNKCTDCHDKIFKQKKGTADQGNAMTMKSMKKGLFCGSCHDGKQAFKVSRYCKKCHVKSR